MLSDQLLRVPGRHSRIDVFRINPGTGKFTPAGAVAITGNGTAGLAVL